MNDKALVIICTRPESARLPGKALMKIAGLPAIEHILHRLQTSKVAQQDDRRFPVILAVPSDCDAYSKLPMNYDIEIFRGNPTSPLHRMRDALMAWWNLGRDAGRKMPNYIIRVTHDDILVDFHEMVRLIDHVEADGAGYGCTPGILDGAGVEVIHVSNLLHAAEKEKGDVEHVSYAVKGAELPNPKVFHSVPRPAIQKPYRLTLDYAEDAQVLEAVLRECGPLASNDLICKFLDTRAGNKMLTHNELPVVSVYVPAYNAEKTIVAALNSVPEQCAFGAVELVVAEDCSTDGTLAKIVENSRELGVDRLIINPKNMGSASTANAALRACRGRYVMRLDADDVLCWGAIQKMMEKMRETGAGVVCAGFTEFHEDGTTKESECTESYRSGHAGCALMDRKVFDVRFEEGRRHWDGLELFNRIRRDGVKVAYVDEPLWFYRKSAKSLSATKTPEREIAKKGAL